MRENQCLTLFSCWIQLCHFHGQILNSCLQWLRSLVNIWSLGEQLSKYIFCMFRYTTQLSHNSTQSVNRHCFEFACRKVCQFPSAELGRLNKPFNQRHFQANKMCLLPNKCHIKMEYILLDVLVSLIGKLTNFRRKNTSIFKRKSILPLPQYGRHRYHKPLRHNKHSDGSRHCTGKHPTM